ncbi:MAG: hypothetical protein KGL39_08070 [Patescibacteria group bacterium]|nr:hypothetical protein [Patescibacteria group bacterium]
MAHPRSFKCGAQPSPRHVLAAAMPHRAIKAPPPQVAYVPPQLSLWGNDQHGDCVTAEEAGAKACYNPEIFITDQTAIGWASQHGVLEGADLSSVLDMMTHDGFRQGGTTYDDGGKLSVDYSNESALQAAIAEGPVKIAIDHTALPASAGPPNGWYATAANRPTGQPDHCVALWGYGPTTWLFQQLGKPLPAGLPAAGYLLFTWGSIGFVDHPWIMATCVEAWVRDPTTVIVGPAPNPQPQPKPKPQPNPGPTPTPGPQPLPPAPASPTFDSVLAALEQMFAGRPRILALLNWAKRAADTMGLGGMTFDGAMVLLEQAAAADPQAVAILREIQAIGDQVLPYVLGDGPFRPGPHPGPGIWPWIRPFLPPYQPTPYPQPYFPPQPYPYYPPAPYYPPQPSGW